MSIGEWVGLIGMIIGIFLSVLESKKKNKTDEESSPRRRPPMKTPAQPVSRQTSPLLGQLAALLDIEEEIDEAPEVAVAPPASAVPPVTEFTEGSRATADSPVPPAVHESLEAPRTAATTEASTSASALNLHDKDALRRAIILSDILPPKF
ncbi:MAG: hypothetical protein ACI31E_01285 [Muribaculaceae bacterium]